MIRFLIEDDNDSPFVKLFNAAYGDKADVLYCTGTNTKLRSKAKKLARDGSRVVVYMDMVPDNQDLHGLYLRLFDLYRVDNLDVVVMPVVCSEYLFIKSIVDLVGPITSSVGLVEILSKSPSYRVSALTYGHNERRFRTFEKFCKLFCECCLNVDCCSVDVKMSGECSKKPYYSCNCFDKDGKDAKDCCKACSVALSLREKSSLFLKQFSVVPSVGQNVGDPLTWGSVIMESRRLVDEYNEMAVSFGFPSRQIPKRQLV